MSRFHPGTVYDRPELHDDAKKHGPSGNAMAGITVVVDELCVFWNPYKKLYANQWIEEPGEFWYSGEGASGTMGETRGNRRLLNAERDGTTVQVFYKVASTGSKWLNLGPHRVVESKQGLSLDNEGKPRTDLRFRLLADMAISLSEPLPAVPPAPAPDLPSESDLWAAQEHEVAEQGPRRRRAPANQRAKRLSSGLKTAYVVRRAIDFGGTCESCGQEPGWLRDDGRPHFQAHHLVADVDLVDWIAAVCGTCHDRLHHGEDRIARAAHVRQVLVSRQHSQGRPTFELEDLNLSQSAVPTAGWMP